MQPVVIGNDKLIPTATAYQAPPIALATPVYQPPSNNQLYQPEEPYTTPYHGEAKVQIHPSTAYMPPVIPETNTCQCQGQKDYTGAWRFPFDGNDNNHSTATSSELVLACCNCQGQTKMDVRNIVFPPHGNVTLKTSGCQQKLQMYIPAEVQVNVVLSGAGSRQRDKRSKEAKAGVQPMVNKFITVKNNEKCCCACQPYVDVVKLDPGQEAPKDCAIM